MHSCPSGLRGSTQVRMYSYSWVQIPQDAILFCTVLADAPLILVPYSTATALWPMMHSPYHAHMHVRIRYMRILLEVLISNINDQWHYCTNGDKDTYFAHPNPGLREVIVIWRGVCAMGMGELWRRDWGTCLERGWGGRRWYFQTQHIYCILQVSTVAMAMEVQYITVL